MAEIRAEDPLVYFPGVGGYLAFAQGGAYAGHNAVIIEPAVQPVNRPLGLGAADVTA